MLDRIHEELGIPANYEAATGLPRFIEPETLVPAGLNIIGREQSLTATTCTAWTSMSKAAKQDGVQLLLVSGFRGIDYQAELIRKKLRAGKSIEEILRVNAAPGFSQHHTGRAVDVATPGVRPLLVEFENTAAFAWLQTHARQHGFSLSYPRDNTYGIDYEPWHWLFQESDA